MTNASPSSATGAATRSAQIRAKLSHPVIDSDGHLMEFEPVVLDKIEEIGGRDLRDRYGAESFLNATSESFPNVFAAELATTEERQKWRLVKGPWWAATPATATRDRAATMLPGYLHER